MFFKTAILLAFVAASIAAPVQKRAVLAEEDYADFQVSDGVAGNAQAEVESHFNVRCVVSTSFVSSVRLTGNSLLPSRRI